jgi:anti-anti-sigma regulatory factor
MADLFLAEARAAGGVRKNVAIKRVQPRHAHDESFLTMFLNEARLASTLQHPNIVQTYDVLHVRGEYFLIMELLEGCDLQEFLRLLKRSPHPLSLGHITYIALRALAALHYAHERTDHQGQPLGIIHRDVSAHNLFLTYQGGVKLLDFGIALADDAEHDSGSNMLKGKVLYMAPEQCQSGAIDRRTDIYAVGVLLYKMLSGDFPYRGTNAYDTMRAILHGEATPLSQAVDDLPPGLEALVSKALEKNPDDRFQTAREMQEALQELAREANLFVSDLEFSNLVTQVAPPDRPRPPVEGPLSLPEDLVVGGNDPASYVPPASMPPQAKQEMVSTEVATIRRVRGVVVLALRGSIDERLDVDTLAPMLEGDLLFDTQHVERITSYGIRQLLALFAAHKGGRVYHINTSPVFLEQVGMIRGLLGGGHVASYFLPFVDPKNGRTFTQRYSGPEGEAIVREQAPPAVSCPGAPNRQAELDDDPEMLLFFAESYLAEPPDHIASAIRACDVGGAARDIEKKIDADGTTLEVHCPITPQLRWERTFRGLEGTVTFDLSEVPYSSKAGLTSLAEALHRHLGDEVDVVRWRGLEIALYPWFKAQDFGARSELLSAKVPTRCGSCGLPRQVIMARAQLDEDFDEGCHRCGGQLQLDTELPELSQPGAPPRPVIHDETTVHLSVPPTQPSVPPASTPPPPSSGIPSLAVWGLLGIALLAFGIAIAMLVLSLVLAV